MTYECETRSTTKEYNNKKKKKTCGARKRNSSKTIRPRVNNDLGISHENCITKSRIANGMALGSLNGHWEDQEDGKTQIRDL